LKTEVYCLLRNNLLLASLNWVKWSQSTPRHSVYFELQFCIIIIIVPMFRCTMWSLFFRFWERNFVWTYLISHTRFILSHRNQRSLRLSPLGTAATVWPIVPAPCDRWLWLWSSRWNANWQGNPKYSEKTCLSTTLSPRNPSCPDLVSNRTAAVGIRRLTAWAMTRPS
jgi:hypothetical protein